MSDTPPEPPGLSPSDGVLEMTVVNRLQELKRIGDRVEQFGRERRLSEDETSHVHLVLDELVSNIIKYGHDDEREHEIRVFVSVDRDWLTISIEDDGRAFNPLEAPAPDLDLPIERRPIGGLGLFLVKSIMDTLEYRREREHNIVTLRKRIAAEGAGTPS